jgi:hypothetical protein
MLEDLRALVEFAHAGSIVGAADRLFRTRVGQLGALGKAVELFGTLISAIV